MNSTFTETQKFNKWWHYLIVGIPVVIVIVASSLVQFDIVSSKDGTKAPVLFMSSIVIACFFFIWFMILKLQTEINSEGIFVNFFGIPFCKRIIKWDDLQSISVITYSPLSDYGGWGARYSIGGNGWCYNVSGKKGIKLVYKTGKPFLIGTQKPEEAGKIINLYFK